MSANQSRTVRPIAPHVGRTVQFHDERMVDGTVREAVADVNRYFSRQRLEHAATQHERGRLARELHDGVLQSLTGATLQLDAIGPLIASDPRAAQARLAAVAESLAEQQRELRQWIAHLRVASTQARVPAAELAASLEKLRDRAAWQHGIDIDLCVTGDTVPRPMGDQIYRLVQEGLTNIGRHARARVAGVHVRLAFGRVTMMIFDDGIGFPYRGRFMLKDLIERQIGPVSLRERVASLGGDLILTSSASGVRVEISLPVGVD
jgi:signal transduction histidine kinase